MFFICCALPPLQKAFAWICLCSVRSVYASEGIIDHTDWSPRGMLGHTNPSVCYVFHVRWSEWNNISCVCNSAFNSLVREIDFSFESVQNVSSLEQNYLYLRHRQTKQGPVQIFPSEIPFMRYWQNMDLRRGAAKWNKTPASKSSGWLPVTVEMNLLAPLQITGSDVLSCLFIT